MEHATIHMTVITLEIYQYILGVERQLQVKVTEEVEYGLRRKVGEGSTLNPKRANESHITIRGNVRDALVRKMIPYR